MKSIKLENEPSIYDFKVGRITRDPDSHRRTWSVTITADDRDRPGEITTNTTEFHSNSAGHGLWCGDKQILGTAQLDASRRKDVIEATLRVYDLTEQKEW